MISLKPLHEAWNGFAERSVYSCKIGPFTIRISSVDAALAQRLTRAFDHLPRSDSSADLTVRIWSGPKLPDLDWNLIQANGYRGFADPPVYFHYFETIHVLSAVDVESNIAYFIVKDRETLPWWVHGSPLQVIFHVWLRERGMQLTHGAAVVEGGRAILLAGKGGSGKSTTVLSCLCEGLHTLGEDYVLLSKTDAFSVYQTAKWQRSTRLFFPGYEKYIANPDTADKEKALIYYQDFFPSQMDLSASIQAVVSLSVGASLSVQKSDVRTSLQSLLLTTAMQLPHADPRTASLLQSFAEPLAHYRLTLGSDFQANAACLRSLLA